jgi:hypothetical protein
MAKKRIQPSERSLAYTLMAVLMDKLSPWEVQKAIDEARIVWSLQTNQEGPQTWSKEDLSHIMGAMEVSIVEALSRHKDASEVRAAWVEPTDDEEAVVSLLEAARMQVLHQFEVKETPPEEFEKMTWDEYRAALAEIFGKTADWDEYEAIWRAAYSDKREEEDRAEGRMTSPKVHLTYRKLFGGQGKSRDV